MVRVKSNLGPSGGGFGYHIDAAPLIEHPDIEATRIVWEEPLEGTARDLLAEAEPRDDGGRDKERPREKAEQFLKNTLAAGERSQKDIMDDANSEGISPWSLSEAAKTAVSKRKAGLQGQWLWRLKQG
jgi:putative DNA primase/helicase